MINPMQCQAKSKRSGVQCKSWAIRGKQVCRMHGARGGIKTPEGRQQQIASVTKHGFYSKEAIESRRKTRQLINYAKDMLRSVE